MKKSSAASDDLDLDGLDPGGGDPPADPPEDGDEGDEGELPEGDEDEEGDEEGDDTGDGDGDQDELPTAARGDQDTGDRQPRSRSERRVQALNARLREERNAREDLQRRFDAFTSGRSQAQQQQTQETQEQRNARRALMSDAERLTEDIAELRRDSTNALRTIQMQTADATDKAAFDAKVSIDDLYSRWAPKVEAERVRLAGLGQFPPREAILKFMLGDAALKARTSKDGKTQRALAARRVNRQKTPANDSRNDTTPSRRGRSLEDRLANQPL